MIIFNDTVIIEESVHEKWLDWMQQVYIPAVMETGYFKSYQVLNVIDSPNEGVTYCVQYYAETIDDFNQFYGKHLHQLQELHNNEFENQFVMFNTLMKTVD
ncbi:MAG TPA: DUF4286 family protein [Mucilaginibacter sp.]|nr:DUF4286 family protein [Mucilaginibacter sp.]